MWRFCCILILLLFGFPFHAGAAEPLAGSGLSADFLMSNLGSSGDTTSGRLYRDDSGMRLENKVGDELEVTIFDFAHNVFRVLDSKNESYGEFAWLDGDMGLVEWLFAREGGPCGQDGNKYLKTTNLGMETMNGRRAQKWRCALEGGAGADLVWTVWDDPSLLTFLRVEFESGPMFSLSNLVVAPQPASLFRVPAGYEKQSDPHAPAIE